MFVTTCASGLERGWVDGSSSAPGLVAVCVVLKPGACVWEGKVGRRMNLSSTTVFKLHPLTLFSLRP